jgi:hypothetical protein
VTATRAHDDDADGLSFPEGAVLAMTHSAQGTYLFGFLSSLPFYVPSSYFEAVERGPEDPVQYMQAVHPYADESVVEGDLLVVIEQGDPGDWWLMARVGESGTFLADAVALE